jgi:hypothetical protein
LKHTCIERGRTRQGGVAGLQAAIGYKAVMGAFIAD